MRIKFHGYREALEGKELIVKKTTRSLADLQRQTGWNLSQLTEADLSVYGGLIAVFCALFCAGFEPSWDELLDRDTDEFEAIQDPGDDRTQEADAADPQNSRADTDPGGVEPQPDTAE